MPDRSLRESSPDRGLPRGSRRQFVQAGGMGCLGMGLPGLFEARAAAAAPDVPRASACIVIFYYGGPSQLDTFDMKPDAPAEVRGEFRPIQSSLPGLSICEHLPHTSRIMHKVTLIRSVTHQMRLHDAACIQILTGRPPSRGDGEFFTRPEESLMFPSLGACVGRLRGAGAVPVAHAALPFLIHNVIEVPCQKGGLLGSAHDPFLVLGDPQALSYRSEMLELPEGLSIDRVQGRGHLLEAVQPASNPASSDAVEAFGRHRQKALDLLASRAVREALDVSREGAATRERYGMYPDNDPGPDNPMPEGGPHPKFAVGRNLRGQNLLVARRLVEAGVPFVNVYDFRQQGQNWDAHRDNFNMHRNYLLPAADRAFAALIDDLDERGLLDTTLVVAVGEFGRTPRINRDAGRDHWPDCYCAVLAGGGIRRGLVYGASDKFAAYPQLDPVAPGDLAATILACLGIDPATEVHDALGRPFSLSTGHVVTELLA